MYTNKHDDDSETCLAVSPGCYWVAVFGLDVNGRMENLPMSVNMVQIFKEGWFYLYQIKQVYTCMYTHFINLAELKDNSSLTNANNVYKHKGEKMSILLTAISAGKLENLILCLCEHVQYLWFYFLSAAFTALVCIALTVSIVICSFCCKHKRKQKGTI